MQTAINDARGRSMNQSRATFALTDYLAHVTEKAAERASQSSANSDRARQRTVPPFQSRSLQLTTKS